MSRGELEEVKRQQGHLFVCQRQVVFPEVPPFVGAVLTNLVLVRVEANDARERAGETSVDVKKRILRVWDRDEVDAVIETYAALGGACGTSLPDAHEGVPEGRDG